MENLKVTICTSPEDATKQGYSLQNIYKNAQALSLKEVVVVRNGTVKGNSTLDLILEDKDGNKFVAMTTANLIKAIPA